MKLLVPRHIAESRARAEQDAARAGATLAVVLVLRKLLEDYPLADVETSYGYILVQQHWLDFRCVQFDAETCERLRAAGFRPSGMLAGRWLWG